MPDVTPVHKVPRPLASDPWANGVNAIRDVAAYLEGIALTSVGSLAAGWGGNGIKVERVGRVVTLYIDVTKASWGSVETITGTTTFLPSGCVPHTPIYAWGINPVDGNRRGFNVLTSGRVQAYGYEDAKTGGIVGSVTYIAPAP